MTSSASWKHAPDKVEVRFKGSKADQKRFGAAMSRQRSAVCPAKIDWQWKGVVPVGTQRVALPLDGCRNFEEMLHRVES